MTTLQRQNLLTKAYYDYRNDLKRYSSFKVNDASIVEDLVQETFLKAWKYLLRDGKIATMRAFLFHVINGLIIDKYRKHKTVSLDSIVEKGFEPKEVDSENIIDTLDSKRAVEMISKLPIKYRQPMLMKYKKDLPLEKISEKTGQSKNTTAVQINRGIKKLKEIYNR